jgi:ppGpp synthetase/RelA/SpoT-type nucleotidyltranferase
MKNYLESFLTQFSTQVDFYKEAASICRSQLEQILKERAIRAIVTDRVKREDRLEAKLTSRNNERAYQSIDEIYDDIVDLAGVRVALYFPASRFEVCDIINSLFQVEQKKEFPITGVPKAQFDNYEKRFDGYFADHYRIRLQPSSLNVDLRRYVTARIEVQVASVLMHAWAEVEHDLIYKPMSGKISRDEHQILDELNGLVLAAELALERLQAAVENRVNAAHAVFNNHYELGAFLHELLPTSDGTSRTVRMGNVDILFDLLKAADSNTRKDVEHLFEMLGEISETAPLAGQLLDLFILEKPELSEKFDSLLARRAQLNENDEYARAFTKFLMSWAAIERSLMRGRSVLNWSRLPELDGLTVSEQQGLIRFRHMRNLLVHGIELPTIDQLANAANELERVQEKLNPTAEDTP